MADPSVSGKGAAATLDVRDMPPPQRHTTIFATFENLKLGEAFQLINDHDPKPLYYHFLHERPGQVGWQPLEEGPEKWVIQITRIAEL